MDGIGFVVALVVLGTLVVPVGLSGRGGIRSRRQEFEAGHRSGESTAAASATSIGGDEAAPKRPSLQTPYPTLAIIERARGYPSRPLTTAPNARLLEARARQLVAVCWSPTARQLGPCPSPRSIASSLGWRRTCARFRFPP